MHNLFGFSVDHIDDLFRNLSIRCNAMLQPHCPKQANANTPEILLKFSTLLNLSDPEDSVFLCLFLFALVLFARISNWVPTSR